MSLPYFIKCGYGDRDLVMLHGWGLNAEVWRYTIHQLSADFRLYLLDLPGFGDSHTSEPYDLTMMTEAIAKVVPKGAILLGWSLGGLVASSLAIHQPNNFSGLITVASSPCFVAKADWPGIQAKVLNTFYQQLDQNMQATISRFITLQTLGSPTARQDIRHLVQALSSKPNYSITGLKAGLAILQKSDLRDELTTLTLPFLRIYGALDRLVPRNISEQLDKQLPESKSILIDSAAHVPFISHTEIFSQQVIDFFKSVK